MTLSHSSALPNLVFIDVGAPLEECVRRLQSQLAYVEALAAQQQQQQHTDNNNAGSSLSPSTLLETFHGASTRGEAEESVALRRRVAQKLRRLCEQHHVDLRTARSVMLPTGDDVDAAAEEEKVSLAAATQQPLPLVQPVHHGALAEDEDDLFGWVTQPTTTTTAAGAAAVRLAEKEAMARRLPVIDEDAVLHRIAVELADMVEQRYRHGEQANDVHQQLLQLRAHTDALLLPEEMKRSDAVATGKRSAPTAQTLSSTQDHGMGDKSVRDAVNTLLSFRPTHTIATEEEKSIWQHAWQSVLPSTPSSPLTAAPTLKVGDRIEAVDTAVLAHVNAQRHVAVLHRWAAVCKEYEEVVEGLNRRTAQAALQLEEMERQKP